MPRYSEQSLKILEGADPKLQVLFRRVIKTFDNKILCAHRGEVDQNAAFTARPQRSKLPWPLSKHNKKPSKAVDAVPYPVKWGEEGTPEQRRKDIARFYFFAGAVLMAADELGIAVRWLGDADGDMDFNDQNFDDLPHFELIE